MFVYEAKIADRDSSKEDVKALIIRFNGNRPYAAGEVPAVVVSDDSQGAYVKIDGKLVQVATTNKVVKD